MVQTVSTSGQPIPAVLPETGEGVRDAYTIGIVAIIRNAVDHIDVAGKSGSRRAPARATQEGASVEGTGIRDISGPVADRVGVGEAPLTFLVPGEIHRPPHNGLITDQLRVRPGYQRWAQV